MCGADGYRDKNLINISWPQFQTWQRWDEFPERLDDPPMTVDMTFWYRGKRYYLDCVDRKYVILSEDGAPAASDANFLRLLKNPLEI